MNLACVYRGMRLVKEYCWHREIESVVTPYVSRPSPIARPSQPSLPLCTQTHKSSVSFQQTEQAGWSPALLQSSVSRHAVSVLDA